MAEATKLGLLEDAWGQVLALLTLVTGIFSVHYFYVGGVPTAIRYSSGSAIGSSVRPKNSDYWVVDARGGSRVDFTTLHDAAAAASDGDVIELAPGTYREDVRVTKAVKIRGDGRSPQDVTITYEGLQTVSVSARVSLENLSVVNAGMTEDRAIEADRAELNLVKVRVKSNGQAIHARDSEVEASESELAARIGLFLEGRSRARLTSVLLNTDDAAVDVSGEGAYVELERSNLHDGRGTVIRASRSSRVRLSDMQIVANAQPAVIANTNADIRIARTDFLNGRECAIQADDAVVTIDDSRFVHGRCGIAFVGPGTLEVDRSQFVGLQLGALAVRPGLEDAVNIRGSGNTGLNIPRKL